VFVAYREVMSAPPNVRVIGTATTGEKPIIKTRRRCQNALHDKREKFKNGGMEWNAFIINIKLQLIYS